MRPSPVWRRRLTPSDGCPGFPRERERERERNRPMRFNRARATGAAILALAIVAGACSSSGASSKTTAGNTATTTAAKPEITIGSEKFSESIIVNEIYAKALESAGYKVTRKFR